VDGAVAGDQRDAGGLEHGLHAALGLERAEVGAERFHAVIAEAAEVLDGFGSETGLVAPGDAGVADLEATLGGGLSEELRAGEQGRANAESGCLAEVAPGDGGF